MPVIYVITHFPMGILLTESAGNGIVVASSKIDGIGFAVEVFATVTERVGIVGSRTVLLSEGVVIVGLHHRTRCIG